MVINFQVTTYVSLLCLQKPLKQLNVLCTLVIIHMLMSYGIPQVWGLMDVSWCLPEHEMSLPSPSK